MKLLWEHSGKQRANVFLCFDSFFECTHFTYCVCHSGHLVIDVLAVLGQENEGKSVACKNHQPNPDCTTTNVIFSASSDFGNPRQLIEHYGIIRNAVKANNLPNLWTVFLCIRHYSFHFFLDINIATKNKKSLNTFCTEVISRNFLLVSSKPFIFEFLTRASCQLYPYNKTYLKYLAMFDKRKYFEREMVVVILLFYYSLCFCGEMTKSKNSCFSIRAFSFDTTVEELRVKLLQSYIVIIIFLNNVFIINVIIIIIIIIIIVTVVVMVEATIKLFTFFLIQKVRLGNINIAP